MWAVLCCGLLSLLVVPRPWSSDTSIVNIGTANHTPHTRSPSDPDANCIFRKSPLYRKIYVYPSPGTDAFRNNHSGIVTNAQAPLFPWEAVHAKCQQDVTCGYDLNSQLMQYNTEILVRQVITHSKSCLTTNNPDEASLFYVPYMPATEFHNGTKILGSYETSPYGQAIMNILQPQPNYQSWEQLFGFTSKYWKRRNGTDHILVFSEPLHGLWHPKSKRGNFHFVHTQKQLEPPIVISVELSTTFVNMYPNCARKNILLPYPNTDGRWFNGRLDHEAQTDTHTLFPVDAQLASERQLALLLRTENNNNINNDNNNINEFRIQPKPLAQFFKSGAHGTCAIHRRALAIDQSCTSSGKTIDRYNLHYSRGFRQSTFCPCPGGDSPSAKRMFDALHGGCIPIILSEDYVWPLTPEFDATGETSTSKWLQPSDFSIRLNASKYTTARHDPGTCTLLEGATDHGLQSLVENLTPLEIQRLRKGVTKASDVYSWFQRHPDLPDNPLAEGILPNGGTAHALVHALAERADGVLWPACQEELAKLPVGLNDPKTFKC